MDLPFAVMDVISVKTRARFGVFCGMAQGDGAHGNDVFWNVKGRLDSGHAVVIGVNAQPNSTESLCVQGEQEILNGGGAVLE